MMLINRCGSCCARVFAPVTNVLRSGLSIEIMALSFAVGITSGVFPVPGITSLVGALLIWLLNGNIIAATAVNYCMTLIHLATVVPFIRAGEYIFGITDPVPFSMEPFSKSLLGALSLYGGALLRAAVAWSLVAPLATFLLYYVLLFTLRPFLQSQKALT